MRSLFTRVAVVGVATVLAAGTLGCSILSKAKDLADTAKVLSNFSDRLGKAASLTYTGVYTVTGDDAKDNGQVTLVQQPPNAAFIGKDGSFIFTKDALFVCSKESSGMTCNKSPNQAGSIGAADSGYIAGAAGAGFVTPEMAIGLIAAAAIVPGASVSQSNKTIAGQSSLCATASGLDAAASPGDTSAPRDFTVCVTDSGVLASFSGTSTDGKKTSVDLTSFSTTVDSSAFAPPPGATIVDSTNPQPS